MAARLITGILLAILVVIAVLYLPSPWVLGAVVIVAGLACFECARLLMPTEDRQSPRFVAILGSTLSALILFGNWEFQILLLAFAVLVMVTLLYFLILGDPLSGVALKISATVFSLFYVGLLFSFLGLLRAEPSGAWWLLLCLGATFSGDTGGYFAGRYLGKHKLALRISPKKTWEGYGGGILLSILVSFFFKYIFFKELSVQDCWVVGLVAGAFGPLGDLCESMLKRSVGVKDSGHLIPGHGGVLDRVDALLFVAPVVYGYVAYIR